MEFVREVPRHVPWEILRKEVMIFGMSLIILSEDVEDSGIWEALIRVIDTIAPCLSEMTSSRLSGDFVSLRGRQENWSSMVQLGGGYELNTRLVVAPTPGTNWRNGQVTLVFPCVLNRYFFLQKQLGDQGDLFLFFLCGSSLHLTL